MRAERALLARLEGGCQIPIGAYAELDGAGDVLVLQAFVGSLDGATTVRDELSGPAAEPEALGRELAARLVAAGAGRILAELRAEQDAS